MTMWANIVHGLGYGWAGIVLSGWPPVALMAAIEVLARMVRPSPAPEADAPRQLALGNGHTVPEGGKEAADKYAAGLAHGELPSLRRVRREMQRGGPEHARCGPISKCSPRAAGTADQPRAGGAPPVIRLAGRRTRWHTWHTA